MEKWLTIIFLSLELAKLAPHSRVSKSNTQTKADKIKVPSHMVSELLLFVSPPPCHLTLHWLQSCLEKYFLSFHSFQQQSSHDDYQPSNIHLIAFVMKIFHISLHKYFFPLSWRLLLALIIFYFLFLFTNPNLRVSCGMFLVKNSDRWHFNSPEQVLIDKLFFSLKMFGVSIHRKRSPRVIQN